MTNDGALAQLGERLHGMQEVSGSIPLGSTIILYPKNSELPRLPAPQATRGLLCHFGLVSLRPPEIARAAPSLA